MNKEKNSFASKFVQDHLPLGAPKRKPTIVSAVSKAGIPGRAATRARTPHAQRKKGARFKAKPEVKRRIRHSRKGTEIGDITTPLEEIL